MYRLLGPHINFTLGGLPELVATWHPPVAVIMDHNWAWHWVRTEAPRSLLVGRLYQEHQPDFNDPDMDPVAAARSWLAATLPTIQSMAGVYNYWQGLNEPIINSAEAMARYATFEITRIRLLAGYGVKAALGSFSVGNPSNMSWWTQFLPAMELGREHGAVLSLHEYNWPSMHGLDEHGNATRFDPDWYCLRHRKVYDGEPSHDWPGLPRRARLPLIITETGLDGILAPPHTPKGWRGHVEAEQYLAELAWYDRELQKDSYVLGAAIFCLAAHVAFEWSGYDVWQEPVRTLADQAYPMYRRLPARPPALAYATGLDVSKWQRRVNWAAVARDGFSFAMIRASVGRYRDRRYRQNYKGARAAGLLVGSYHFQTAHDPPAQQAQVFALNYRRNSELGAFDDVEIYEGAGPNERQVKLFARSCRGFGVHPGFYTSRSMWRRCRQSGWAGDRTLWVADWARKRFANPRLPRGWDTWEFQQTTSRGVVTGIRGRVDLDIFNGSEEELRRQYG